MKGLHDVQLKYVVEWQHMVNNNMLYMENNKNFQFEFLVFQSSLNEQIYSIKHHMDIVNILRYNKKINDDALWLEEDQG
jgi:hypothetical protein